jgi:uncharacterized protein YrzB (UPF0473 family)
MKKDTIIIKDEEKKTEKEMKILFSYENPETKNQYVFFFDDSKPDEIYVMRYDDKGNLFEIESDEEYSELDEVLDSYSKDLEKNNKESK